MIPSGKSQAISQTIEQLAEQVRRIEGARRVAAETPVSSGSRALDRLLPEGGIRRGSLVEWLCDTAAGGAGTLALIAAHQAAATGGALVVIDRSRRFYPPAAVGLGIDLGQLIVVRPGSEADHAWALDQTLRSRGVAAVWTCPPNPDDHALRRWQLAAETSGVVGMLLRGRAARHEPSWADLRLLVDPLPLPPGKHPAHARRLRVELLRCRGGHAGGIVELEITSGRGAMIEQSDSNFQEQGHRHETRAVHLASQLALAKTGRRSRGA